ncbi:MAG: SDR family NAD(P)-dependent oxidoreductase [Armatimonadota bacterium]
MGMLDSRVAFITGAASGIGAATARRFAEEGAAVAIADIQKEAGERLRDELTAAGHQALFTYCDVSVPDSVQAAVETTVRQFGALHIVCANAGINGMFAPVDDLQPDEWDRTLAVNLKGTFLTVHFTVPHLKKAQGGSIIITSSVNGTRSFSFAGASAYSTSKAGQVAFMKMMSLELGRYGIRCNAVCPGAIHTNINDSTTHRNTESIRIRVQMPEGNPVLNKGWGEANDVAGACLMLASDLGRHISGLELFVDGGASLLR